MKVDDIIQTITDHANNRQLKRLLKKVILTKRRKKMIVKTTHDGEK